MRTPQSKDSTFQKVGECLYRYSNGVYYARIKHEGKEIKRSLRTTDKDLAKRALARLRDEQGQIDSSQGKLTLAELCDRYLKTLHGIDSKTLKQKSAITEKIKLDWPTGNLVQVAKIKPTECDLWLAGYHFGASSRNVHIQCLREVFAVALRDRVIVASPAQHLKYAKRDA
ncbi:MAG: hypothetical protein DME75_12090, partial [Verrucomicrobia bacterium]